MKGQMEDYLLVTCTTDPYLCFWTLIYSLKTLKVSELLHKLNPENNSLAPICYIFVCLLFALKPSSQSGFEFFTGAEECLTASISLGPGPESSPRRTICSVALSSRGEQCWPLIVWVKRSDVAAHFTLPSDCKLITGSILLWFCLLVFGRLEAVAELIHSSHFSPSAMKWNLLKEWWLHTDCDSLRTRFWWVPFKVLIVVGCYFW